jgi:Ca-activated chloride channel family protein
MIFAETRLLALSLVAPAAALAVWALARARHRAERGWAGRAVEPRLRAGAARSAWTLAALAGLAVLGTALALARPRWGTAERTVERRGVDVVFVLDTSLSMAAPDVAPSRFWLAQSLVRRMAAAMPGNRVALVAAEGVGVVLSPLTVDGAVIDLLLDAAEPGTLPVPGTRLAPALDRALALFPAGSETHPVMVVVSDGEVHGEDLSGAIERLQAAGVVVHVIGVGTRHGAPIPLAGHPGEVKRDAHGEVVITRLEPVALERLAHDNGGVWLEADGADADPEPVLDRIAGLRGRIHDSTTLASLEERFQWPLALAVAALGFWLALGPFRARRAEEVAT